MKHLKIFILVSGVLIIMVNTFTLIYGDSNLSFDKMASTSFFLFRQILSLFAAFSLIITVIYINNQNNYKKKLHLITFVICVLGNVLLFTHEWTQIFFIRELALNNPETLLKIEKTKGLTLFDISALSALGVFVFGWIIFLVFNKFISTISKYSRWIIIIGFFLSPFLSIIMNPETGAFFGSLVIGLGFLKLYSDFVELESS